MYSIIIFILILIIIILLLELHRQKIKQNNSKIIYFFGRNISMEDFVSFIITCIINIVINNKTEFDLREFISMNELESDNSKYTIEMIEKFIVLYSKINCRYIGDYKYKIDLITMKINKNNDDTSMIVKSI